MAQQISETDLILNPDGSIYHLNLLPEDVAETIITVGDPDRVEEVTKHFDKLELRKGKREFITHTGWIGNKRLTVISTGIGTDNIDIVFNELDALVNVDFGSRQPKEKLTRLNFIRIGTSGTIQEDIPIGSILVSEYSVGLDTLMHYYKHDNNDFERELQASLQTHLNIEGVLPYISAASTTLLENTGAAFMKGVTVSAPGFYGPQGRVVRANNAAPDLIQRLNSFTHKNMRITNLEMETAGIYALARALGHNALSVNAILASRVRAEFSKNPQKVIETAITEVLKTLT